MGRAKKGAERSILEVRRELVLAYRELKEAGGWRAVGRRYGISGGMAYRIAVQGYEPHEGEIRRGLGLAVMLPAPACPVCGVVHVRKTCPTLTPGHGEGHGDKAAVPLRGKGLFEMSRRELRWRLENREEF